MVPVTARTVQDETTVGMHWAAAQHRLRCDLIARWLKLHLRQDIRELHWQRLVEHYAESSLVGVLAHQSHRLGEVRIVQRRHRDQQMVRERRVAHAMQYGHAAELAQGTAETP